jgi:2-polyprenyl-6-hydroxyphenyl methylase/3-demethylubiquinone-9 3-methyltransferase
VEPNAPRFAIVNNDVYSTLGTRWYEAADDPIALLRAESRLRNPWIELRMKAAFGRRPCAVLDVGCGGGFLSNYLAAHGHRVTGLDSSSESLEVAARYDETRAVRYESGDALALPYEDGAFDVVCAMDFLEHVEDPEQVIAEAARVLAPAGLFFFHTFNRNWLSWLVVIKGVEWFVKNTPKDMHVLRLFLKPEEVAELCGKHELEPVELLGSRPRLGASFWKMLVTGVVPNGFSFAFSRSTRLGFTGLARKLPSAARPPRGSNVIR